eukprot:PhM_4_TR17470/c0_g1_i3/m.33027/K01205/NAGLU; alpha-N-acetylglucosaminidase
MMKISGPSFLFLLFATFAVTVNGIAFVNPLPTTDPAAAAAMGVLKRVFSSDPILNNITFKIGSRMNDGRSDSFTVETPTENNVLITASSITAATAGAHYYFRFVAGCSVAWGVNATGRNVKLPTVLPMISPKGAVVTHTSLGMYRYYYNVVTYGYTTAFWSFDEWEREIDWMALHGINLPLASIGQEYVTLKTFEAFNLTFDEIVADQFTGPAFLPWERMGNIRKWAGPMSEQFLESTVSLQRSILARMRELQMKPVMPAFAGFVPKSFKAHYPNASLIRSADWLGNASYSEDYLLNPNDPLFFAIGKKYLEIQQDLFGTDHLYSCDTWNEMDPPKKDVAYLKATSAAVYNPIQAVDPDGVWVMQGWLFVSSPAFWTNDTIKAYLSGVPSKDRLLILDLTSEYRPVFKQTEGYYGYPFVWCMLHNYGGQRGLYGNLTHIVSAPVADALSADYPSMSGVGLTMEATEQNIVVYELFLDATWLKAENGLQKDINNKRISKTEISGAVTNLSSWVTQYATARYQTPLPSKAFLELARHNGAYDHFPTCCWHYDSMTMTPTFNVTNVFLSYDANSVVDAWLSLRAIAAEMKSKFDTTTWRYDYVDVTRQVLALLFTNAHQLYANVLYRLEGPTTSDEKKKLVSEMRTFMTGIISTMDELLATDPNFMLGPHIDRARKLATSGAEANLFEFNMRTQVTLWGPMGAVHDYAGKPWSGLLSEFELPRWNDFFDVLVKNNTRSFNDKAFFREVLPTQYAFTQSTDRTNISSTPHGDYCSLVDQIESTYMTINEKQWNIKRDVVPVAGSVFTSNINNIGALSVLCKSTASCVGFTTDGQLWLSVSGGTQSKKGVDFYTVTIG